MFNYDQVSVHYNMVISIHQCLKFSNDTKLVHWKEARKVSNCLSETCSESKYTNIMQQITEKRIKDKPDLSKGIGYFVGLDLSGGWTQVDSDHAT